MHSPRAHNTALAPITVVGSGRVGNAIARALSASGRQASLVDRDGLDDACRDAAIVLLCVPDGQIAEAAVRVAAAAPALRFIGHTSGATQLNTLAAATQGAETFSLHPLQTVPTPTTDLSGAPAAIAGSSQEALELARSLAVSCGMAPFEVPEASRAAYHAAAAMASNFLVSLEVSAEELFAAAGIEGGRKLLAPLVLSTANNWAEHGFAALTGPIARGDEATVDQHLRAIEALAPELTETYRVLADRTRTIASTGVGG
jgi:predicted short-subunit dehydrogenase-like oxidoreductase (DUF2520 family)